MGESPTQARHFRVAGMSCEACAERVERALKAVPGVEAAAVDLAWSAVEIRVDRAIGDTTLAAAVEAAGYTLVLTSGEPGHWSEPEPAPTPLEPLPAPEPIMPPLPQEAAAGWRDRLPPLRTVWFVASRGVLAAIALSLFMTLVYRFVPVPTTWLMLGESLFGDRSVRREWVSLERISPNLVRAVIASEDGEFCRHWGFDFKEMQQAWEDAQDGGRMRGASTISQQTAKNVFLWSGRSWFRKGLEVYFTALVELFWPKRRIMEVYLNVAEWGPGIFGAEAASRHWFKKPASQLTRLEAARLAAILPSPKRYRANPPGPYITSRGFTIAARANSVDLNGADNCAKP
jgi:monofunctional biosynthetic peptidoglycan transglycosylase